MLGKITKLYVADLCMFVGGMRGLDFMNIAESIDNDEKNMFSDQICCKYIPKEC